MRTAFSSVSIQNRTRYNPLAKRHHRRHDRYARRRNMPSNLASGALTSLCFPLARQTDGTSSHLHDGFHSGTGPVRSDGAVMELEPSFSSRPFFRCRAPRGLRYSIAAISSASVLQRLLRRCDCEATILGCSCEKQLPIWAMGVAQPADAHMRHLEVWQSNQCKKESIAKSEFQIGVV